MGVYRVVIAEDIAEVAADLQEKLEIEPEVLVVGVARTGVEACTLAAEIRPDVVLMDIDMPAMDGIVATRQIKCDTPESHVVMLTVFDDTPHMFEAIRAGAMSYLIKGCGSEDILREIRAVMSGDGSIPPAQVRFILAEFDRLERQAASLRRLYETLSKAEIAVLNQVAQGKTNLQIARLHGTEQTTVKGHVTAILKKLHVNSRLEAAEIAGQSGLNSNVGNV